MSTTWPALRLVEQGIAPWVYKVISTMTGTPTTAYGVDSTKFTDSNGDYLNAKSMVGEWIFRPASTTTERERRIGGNSGAPIDYAANARFYHGGPVWTGAPVAGDAYEIHKLRPTESFNLLNECLAELLVATVQEIPMGTDFDMETAGVTNWTASNLTGGSSIKTTTAGKVYSGTQSLRVLLSGASGYYQSATITAGIIPGKQAWVSGKIQVDTAGPFFITAYDVTNSAVIATSPTTLLENYVHIEKQYQIPATCEQVAYRLTGTANLDDAYFGPIFHQVEGGRAPIDMPSWLTRSENLRKIMGAKYVSQYANGVYDAYSRVFTKPYQQGRDYTLRVNPHYAHPYTLEWRDQPPRFGEELWMEALRPAKDVITLANTAAGESTSIPLDEHMLALMHLRKICISVLNSNPNDQQAIATKAYIDGPKGKVGPLASLLKDYERDLVTVQQEPVVLPTYRSWF